MLKLKLQYFGHLMWSWLIGKDSDAGRDWGQEEKGKTEDEMAGWHHRLDGCEFEWTLGDGDGQGGLAYGDSWGRKESDMTEWLNWTEGLYLFIQIVTFLQSFWIQLHWFKMYCLLPYTHPCEFPQILVKCLWKAWAFHKLSCFLSAQFPGPGLCPRREEAIKCFVFLVKVIEVKS